MNENKDNFGLDNIQPLEPVMPSSEPEEQSFQEETPVSYTEMPTVEPEMRYAFDNTEPIAVDPVVPVEPEPIVEEPVYTERSESFTEIPVSSVTEEQPPTIDMVNEHPDAKISLHKEANTEIPVASNLPEEKMDKGTMWLLIWLFLGLMIVIIALPYLFGLL